MAPSVPAVSIQLVLAMEIPKTKSLFFNCPSRSIIFSTPSFLSPLLTIILLDFGNLVRRGFGLPW